VGGTTFAECAFNAMSVQAWASYGSVSLASDGCCYFQGDSYTAFTDSITVTAPAGGGVLDLLWWYFDTEGCKPVSEFDINGYVTVDGCPSLPFVQTLPFTSGVAMPIMASISGTVYLSNSNDMAPNSFIDLEYIEALNSAGAIIPASITAASGTKYELITTPEPSSLALFALASGLILARRRLFG